MREQHRMNYIVSAYNAAPSSQPWDATQEAGYWRGIASHEKIKGVELPFDMSLHSVDEDWLLKQIPQKWDIVVTLIPGTVRRMKENARFGLASKSAQSRASALDFCRRARLAIGRINAALGRNAVVAVQIHSAPSVVHPYDAGSKAALVDSLCEMSSWDWMGARLVIEHCDAFSDRHQPAKGFLSQQTEIQAVLEANEQTGANIGVSVNWARSVIEARQTSAVLTHIENAHSAGVLAGIVFSGCSPEDTHYGPAWADAHLPPAAVPGLGERFEEAACGSLLTQHEIVLALSHCDPNTLDFLGIKVAAPRAPNLTTQDRTEIVRGSIDAIASAAQLGPLCEALGIQPGP